MNIVAVSKRLGHENVEITLKVYTHLLKENEDEIIFEIFKDNNNIGSCFVSIFETCGCIHNVEINEAFRGNGYSKLLLQYSLYDIKKYMPKYYTSRYKRKRSGI